MSTTKPTPQWHVVLLSSLALLWLGGTIGGIGALTRFSATRGEAPGQIPESWPADLPRDGGRASLVMFAHPRCSCTHASISELARLLARAGERVETTVVFLRPEELGETNLVERAKSLPGTRVVADLGGRLSERFGVRTSGHVVLYGSDGRLRFSGGITPSRGHEGGSIGQQKLLLALGASQPTVATAEVFGCGLRDPDERKTP